MKRVISTLIATVLMTGPIWAQDSSGDSEKSDFVPRSARGTSTSAFTFVGNKKGLKIIDHRTGITTYYTARKSRDLQRLSPEAQRSADEHREEELTAQADYEAEQKKQAEAKAAEESAKATAKEAAKAAVEEANKQSEGGEGEEQ